MPDIVTTSRRRRGEIAGLSDEDVDGCRIQIRRQRLVRPSRSWDQDRVYIRPTTKGRRERTVVVSEEMGALLRCWKARRAEEQLSFGSAYGDEGWIGAEADGSAIHPDTVSSRFRVLERKAAVPHRGLHACRHTHAEMALAASTLGAISKGVDPLSAPRGRSVRGRP